VNTLADPTLLLAADVVGDLEKVRMANANRLGVMTRVGADVDGEERGWGLSLEHPQVAAMNVLVDGLKALEDEAVKGLQKAMREHPLWNGWGKGIRGVGEKQLARLIGCIGDPYVNASTGEPRRVSQLWAYSGLHVVPGTPVASDDQVADGAGAQVQGGDASPGTNDNRDPAAGVAPRRRRGQKANWSTVAKTRAYLVSESCVKQLAKPCTAEEGHVEDACKCSVFRIVYDARRAHTAITHPEWTAGHSANDAMRIVSKAILKSLWRAAREWHIENDTFTAEQNAATDLIVGIHEEPVTA
jgi:hypothetical protein